MMNTRRLTRVFLMILVFHMIGFGFAFSDAEDRSEYKIGDVIGSFKKSNVKMNVSVANYENGLEIGSMRIPAYEVGNDLCFVAEDLVYYGYTSIWNPTDRTTRLYIGPGRKNTSGTSRVMKSAGDIYFSDIKIFIDGNEMEAFNIGGYSLVKMSDVVELAGPINFERALESDMEPQLSGQILLPDGEKAPESGIEVAPVFYYFDSGYLKKYVGDRYIIEENESSVDFKISLPVNDIWNKMGFGNHRIYKYIGYEIYGDNGFLSYDLTDTTNMSPIYLDNLSDYKASYDDLKMCLLKEQSIKKTLNLSGDVFDIFSPLSTRAIRVVATDKMSNKRITQTKRVDTNEREIEFDFDLVADREYSFVYLITVYGGFRGRMPLPPSPQYATFYYDDGGVSTVYDEHSYIRASDENASIEVSIDLPDVVIGDAYMSDKAIIHGSESFNGYIVNGRYLVRLSDFYGEGCQSCALPSVDIFELVEALGSAERFAVEQGIQSTGKLMVSNFTAYKDDVHIPIYNLIDDDDAIVEYVLVDDLKKFGYQVHYGDVIELIN